VKRLHYLRCSLAFALVLTLLFCSFPAQAHAVYVREFFDSEKPSPSLTEEEREENLRIIADFLRDEMGLNAASASAVIANISRECSFDPRAVDEGREFFGICQWSKSRWVNYTFFCLENKLDGGSLDSQLRFLQYELEHDYTFLLNILLDCENSEDGALYAQWCFCQYFEAPTDLDGEQMVRALLVYEVYWPLLSEGELARPEA
jgi:hypothetical protein